MKNSLKNSGWAFASESFLWHSFACPSDRYPQICMFFERGAIMGYFANKMLFDLIVKAKEKFKESIEMILNKFDCNQTIYPGHGDVFNLKDYN